MTELDNSNRDLLREAAKVEIAALNESRKLILEQHSHSFKWLMASLLAINGGASIAVLNAESISAHTKVLSGAFFAIGIFSALLVAVASQKISIKSLLPIQSQIGYWISVSRDGERVESTEGKLQGEMKAAIKLAWTAPLFGWISALLFVCGLGVIAMGLLNVKEARPNEQGSGSCR